MLKFGRTLKGAVAGLLLAGQAVAGTLTDPVFGYSVDVPDHWKPTWDSQGGDQVLQMISPDGNAYGEVRAIHLERGVTAGQLRDTFAQVTFPEAVLVGSGPDTISGIPGQIAAWRFNMDGQKLVAGGFFGVDGPVGYILITITSEDSFDTYSPAYDEIFNTFLPGKLVTAYLGEGEDNAATQPGLVAPPKPPSPPASVQPPATDAGATLHEGLVVQRYPGLGFQIVHKDTWAADQLQVYSLRLGLASAPASHRPSIVIEALSGDAYPDLQAAAEDVKTQLLDFPGASFDQEGPQRIETLTENGQPLAGWSFGAVYNVNGVPFRQISYLFKRQQPSAYYMIYVTGPVDTLLQYQPEMMAMLSTLEMIPFE